MNYKQLTLNIQLNPESTFENYIQGDNQQLCAQLHTLPNQASQFIYLWGPAGVGCSHLLQASCHHMLETHKTVCYFNMRDLLNLDVEVFSGLENVDCICLDEIHLIKNENIWQEALFHLYNRLKETSSSLVITANCAPRHLGFSLADLVSRLSQCLIFQVHELSDENKQKAVVMHLNQRGMRISDDVANYLVQHAPRDMPTLLQLIETLDHASLSEQRRLTIPFIKQVLI
jgi:DnaA-homolog protein